MRVRSAKFARSAISKTVLIVVLVIILLVAGGGYYALTLATSTSTSTSTSTLASSTQLLSTITYEQALIPRSIDPASSQDGAGQEIIMNAYEPLVWFNGSSTTLVPWLAQNYSISSNGTTYTFNLRTGIQFCDGTPFNASAVKFSLDRAVIMNQPVSWMLSDFIEGAQTYALSNHTQSDVNNYLSANGVQVLGNYEVAIHLASPYSAFLKILANNVADIVSPSYVEAHGGVQPGQQNSWMLNQGACGTGPYTLQSYDASSGAAVLQANTHYWGGPYGSDVPKTKTVIIKSVTSPSTMVLDMKAGTANLAEIAENQMGQFINMTAWTSNGEIQSVASGIKVEGPFKLLGIDAIAMNEQIQTSTGSLASFQPFANKDVREAMAYAFDYQSYITNGLDGFAIYANQPIPKGMFGFDSNISYPSYNLTEAKDLLVQAGQQLGFSPSNPKTVPVYYTSGSASRQTAMVLMSQAINNLGTGLELQPQALSFPTYINLQRSHQVTMWVAGWSADYVDPTDMLSVFAVNPALAGYSGYHDQQAINLIQQQAATTDTTTRLSLISQAIQLIVSDYAYVWIAQPIAYQVMQSNVHGYFFNPNMPAMPGPYFATIYALQS